MAILCGIQATLSFDKRPGLQEYRDRGQNKVLDEAPEQEAFNKVTNYVALEVDDYTSLKVRCSVQPDFAPPCQYLAFLVSVNGHHDCFTFAETASLKSLKSMTINVGNEDGSPLRTLKDGDVEENVLELRIYEMKAPAPKFGRITCPLPLVDGTLSTRGVNKLPELKKQHNYVHEDPRTKRKDEYQMELANDPELPLALFTWKYADSETLETLRIAPPLPQPPYELLTSTPRYAVVNLQDLPPAPWKELIRGKRLVDLERSAFRTLSYSNLKKASDARNLGIEEIERLASRRSYGMDLSHLPLGCLSYQAELYVHNQVFSQVHTRTLRILAVDKFRASSNRRRQMTADSVARELAQLSDEQLEDLAEEQKICEKAVGKMPIDTIKNLAVRQLEPAELEQEIDSMSTFDVKKYASKRLMETRYIKAQIQAIATIVGEKLLADQQQNEEQRNANAPEAQQPRRVEEPAAQIQPRIKGESPGAAQPQTNEPAAASQPRVQPRIVPPRIKRERRSRASGAASEVAPAASGSGEGSSSGRRTRANVDGASSDRPAKRSRAA